MSFATAISWLLFLGGAGIIGLIFFAVLISQYFEHETKAALAIIAAENNERRLG